MKHAVNGDTVKVHYTGLLDDSTVFDSSAEDTLEFTIGEGRLIRGFEEAVVGMSAGDTKTVTIPSDEAYGPRREELLFRIGRDAFPSDIEPAEGLVLDLKNPEGEVFEVTIAEVSEDEVTLDANHPLAGRDITFEIRLVEIAGP